jgi:muconolactone delta-isomerase
VDRTLPDDVVDRLRAAHAGVARGLDVDGVLEEVRAADGAFAQYGYREQALLFHGDAVDHLDAIVSQLTRSALAHGGFKAEALAGHVASACRMATADEAIEHLAHVLTQPATEHTFGEAIRAHFLAAGPITIGRCLLHRSLESAVPNDPPEALQTWQKNDYPGAVITATVTAHDADSAYLRAVDAIDEAKAIMWLVSEQSDRARRAPTLTLKDGRIAMHSSGGTPALGNLYLTDELLFPPYTHISGAAAKEPDERNEWERRVIAAARWHYQAGTTTWPSAALTASMTALEALLLEPGLKGKGGHLAGTLRDLGAQPWGPPDVKFTKWFADLYDHRNDTTHEGHSYEEDLNVGRLLTITRLTIRWAADHLDRFHPSTHGRACTTLDEALATHLR